MPVGRDRCIASIPRPNRAIARGKELASSDLMERPISRLGNRPTEVASCLDPEIDGLLSVVEGFGWRYTVCHAPRQVRDLDDERVVVRTPEHDQVVLVRWRR